MSRFRLIRLATLLGLAALVLNACSGEELQHRERFYALGTLVEVTIHGQPERTALAAADRVRRRLEDYQQRWHPAGDGELGQINRALAAGETSPAASDELLALLATGRELERLSGGLFTPAIGELIRLWGFEDDGRDAQRPDPQALEAWLSARPSLRDLREEDGRLASDHTGLRLNLGGYAKGYLIGQAVDDLRRQGIERAVVNVGGDLLTLGEPRGRPWRIGIRHPHQEGIIASLEVGADTAVFTSGDYERDFEQDGERYHHILDPRSGHPARGLSAATVVHSDPVRADAASTALMLAGPEDWPAVARRLGVQRIMLVEPDGRIHLTESMQAHLRVEQTPEAGVRSWPDP
ncbi:FAD:protein FMN transferase [Alkalilimnicola ehrlichii MLHE-1]|uniref:FAD:protein FMN transferase n=1 Tax=Alkalilimnicola ehrlichii (strain ATCC BAA-1101 / DSM 17681 / MLHE-1) TaxID=187272 RepID=Q0ABS9_ALKEH|nr:FAD:protein FMN transferase [Alkalilimnicola ehrlichii]ABI55708.1 ApbE family lipoprotein [Alkalilimnicola ehrlichii MLHE-1]